MEPTWGKTKVRKTLNKILELFILIGSIAAFESHELIGIFLDD